MPRILVGFVGPTELPCYQVDSSEPIGGGVMSYYQVDVYSE